MNDRWDDEADAPHPPSLGQVVIGLLLIAWGAEMLLERIIGLEMSFVPLAAGVSLLAAYARNEKFPFFVAGAAITGWGVGAMIGAPFPHAIEDALGSFGTAAGFAFVGVRHPRAVWAFIAAAVFALFGFGSLGAGLAGLIGRDAGRLLLPASLVLGGGLLLFRPLLPRSTVRAGLVAAAALAVLSASAVTVDWADHSHRHGGFFDNDRRTVQTPLTITSETDLMIDAGDADVSIVPGVPMVRYSGGRFFQRNPGAPVINNSGTTMVVTLPDVSSVQLSLPPGTDFVLETDSGDIRGTIPWRGNQQVRLLSDDGDVNVSVPAMPEVDVEADDIDVDGEERENRGFWEGPDGTLDIRTSDEVEVDRAGR